MKNYKEYPVGYSLNSGLTENDIAGIRDMERTLQTNDRNL